MKKLLFFIILFCFFNTSLADELFVGYLKPYQKKSEDRTLFKRKDPTEEPYKIGEKFLSSGALRDREEKITGIELKAILYNPVHKKAYINESLVAVGDKIGDDIIIKDIKENTVILEKDKRTFILKIEEGEK
ncbi:MAG: hypothetical protein N2999_01460 [Proteobacteria bacterium]|nr:hypothetical protein [Pseudomonadota bacterium]